ncbi:filamin-A-like isoform X2 [Haliotis asinina]|uniref:filamin-A-like isoform X2 n=1 Tax=Haliotis asinina TaxID=109174 RepID=UPI0035327B91
MSDNQRHDPSPSLPGVGNLSAKGPEDTWVQIQHKTFSNWVNEQLTTSGRTVDNLATDFCDGVKLVALIEALQFRKIGRVYTKPRSRIQMLQNVQLAFEAIAEDQIRLVNIGNEDVVNGNLKLVLGLLWHLILRYQISSSKSKAPPKKLMMAWFKSVLTDINIGNFTTDWNDGIALHALIEYCKPGTSPDWRSLRPQDKVENCRRAMQLAKQHLNVPKVISPEDFASSALDELSAMTYLSYFLKKDSPGYYSTLNWVCRQLRTTAISNLSTDWNDGFYLCSIVHSLGGEVSGWPNVDRNDHVGNCQKGIDAAKALGVEPLLTAAEMADPSVDQLALMAYISKFQKVTPRKAKAEKLVMNCTLSRIKEGTRATFSLDIVDVDVAKGKTKVEIRGSSTQPRCEMKWKDKVVECSFVPTETGEHQIHVYYDGEEILGSPMSFKATPDASRVNIKTSEGECRVGDAYKVLVDLAGVAEGECMMELTAPSGDIRTVGCNMEHGNMVGSFHPTEPGNWKVTVLFEGQEVQGSPVTVRAYDVDKAWMSGPQQGFVGERSIFTVNWKAAGSDDISVNVTGPNSDVVRDVEVVNNGGVKEIRFAPQETGRHTVRVKLKNKQIRGSPCQMEVFDPNSITVMGDGLSGGVKAEEAHFIVDSRGTGVDITVHIESKNGTKIDYQRYNLPSGATEYRYIPHLAGAYRIDVMWGDRHVSGSPFFPGFTDRSGVTLLDDLEDRKDEQDRIALEFNKVTTLDFDTSNAGPGRMTCEILGPLGKIPVHVNQKQEEATVSFTAKHEGDHYIHIYWSDVPLEWSPLLAYCPGPILPVDVTKVHVVGNGAVSARATVQAEFVVDGKKAGPGVCRVRMQGVRDNLAVDVKPIKYDRYRCTYTSPNPGGFLLYVYWSDDLVPGCPFKITVTPKGDVSKVKVTGEGLRGGIAGQELTFLVNTKEAGPGEITATCTGTRQSLNCDVMDDGSGLSTVRLTPVEAEKHLLQIRYDGATVPGSPFVLRIGEPPNPAKVKVFGPGLDDGLIQVYESKFLVDTHGAGAGQLAVKIKGPKGGFKVDMRREGQSDRNILCRYDPTEQGQYIINVRWSGVHVPGSPFEVNIFESHDSFRDFLQQQGRDLENHNDLEWREDI